MKIKDVISVFLSLVFFFFTIESVFTPNACSKTTAPKTKFTEFSLTTIKPKRYVLFMPSDVSRTLLKKAEK